MGIMLTGSFEKVATAVLVVAACAIAVSAVHREFIRPGPPGLITVGGPSAPPEYLDGWESFLDAATVVGNSDARVRIVEFADLECPFCQRFHESFERALENSEDVALYFIHFPLLHHKFAMPAAKAAECAGEQGRFGEMVSSIFRNQDSLGLKSWGSYANDAMVSDTVLFGSCITRTEPFRSIERGVATGAQAAVRGTPTVLINGWRYPIAPFDRLETEIESFLRHGRPSDVGRR
jgi:protein-disulfide isomerase